MRPSSFSHALLFTVLIAGTACSPGGGKASEGKKNSFATAEKAPDQPMEKVTKNDADWKKQLTPEQYRVTRKAGTEMAYGKAYKEFNQQGKGKYFCVCCGNLLFASSAKFSSGCGWPSFYDPATATGVREKPDNTGTQARIEVLCSKCDAHLGHVFAGEGFDTPTDRRFCINAAALKFVQASPE